MPCRSLLNIHRNGKLIYSISIDLEKKKKGDIEKKKTNPKLKVKYS
jgi:hypothetical protein